MLTHVVLTHVVLIHVVLIHMVLMHVVLMHVVLIHVVLMHVVPNACGANAWRKRAECGWAAVCSGARIGGVRCFVECSSHLSPSHCLQEVMRRIVMRRPPHALANQLGGAGLRSVSRRFIVSDES